ncbi:MAG TPA: hypothetical protein VFU99_00105 [Gaiellaceae bacterium]|nr:hypothetical protein [Gaiellaceae bacterium]
MVVATYAEDPLPATPFRGSPRFAARTSGNPVGMPGMFALYVAIVALGLVVATLVGLL